VEARGLAHSSEGFQAGHNLHELWSVLKTELTRLVVVVDRDEEITVLDSLIQEFHERDPGSFRFRYTRDKQGSPLRAEQDQIQLTVFAEGCRAIRNWLGGLVDMLADLRGAQP